MEPQYVWGVAGLGGAIFLGATTQRISGVGFALVASPFLVVLLGPFNGILVINFFGVLTSSMVFIQLRKRVEYRRAFLMMIPAIIAVIPGSWVARYMPAELLSALIGVMIIFALTASLFVRNVRVLSGRAGAVIAGAISGFMNVTAGVGGPAVTAYAVATRWPQGAFAATAQLYFLGVGTASLVAKQSLPQLDGIQWGACAVALGVGIVLGHILGPRVPEHASRIAVIVLAFAGALLILVRAAIALGAGA